MITVYPMIAYGISDTDMFDDPMFIVDIYQKDTKSKLLYVNRDDYISIVNQIVEELDIKNDMIVINDKALFKVRDGEVFASPVNFIGGFKNEIS